MKTQLHKRTRGAALLARNSPNISTKGENSSLVVILLDMLSGVRGVGIHWVGCVPGLFVEKRAVGKCPFPKKFLIPLPIVSIFYPVQHANLLIGSARLLCA